MCNLSFLLHVFFFPVPLDTLVFRNKDVLCYVMLLVLDFLTNRQQCVGTECEMSSTIAINTGAPQGCVLSAILFIVYTNALSLSSENCKIIKYAVDTVVIGLISDNKEKEYKSTIDYVSRWCSDDCLHLNASKPKEIVLDM